MTVLSNFLNKNPIIRSQNKPNIINFTKGKNDNILISFINDFLKKKNNSYFRVYINFHDVFNMNKKEQKNQAAIELFVDFGPHPVLKYQQRNHISGLKTTLCLDKFIRCMNHFRNLETKINLRIFFKSEGDCPNRCAISDDQLMLRRDVLVDKLESIGFVILDITDYKFNRGYNN